MKIKKFLSIILTILLIISVCPLGVFDFTASAATATSGTTGDCTWELDGTVLTISGNGAMGNYSMDSTLPWSLFITEVIIENGVTSIGGYAFYKHTSLASVTIGSGVTNIGNYAFRDCTRLKSVTIPDSVTSIKSGAFDGCTGLTSITIPKSVTSISHGAFWRCQSLTSVTIPDSVTSIGYQAFYCCTGLTSVTIPNSVTSIDSGAFNSCTGLKSVTIPNSVTSIGSIAFSNCTKLTDVTIGNGVTSIGEQAFCYCSNLTDIYYAGTSEQWAEIEIEDNNNYLTKATKHYKCCTSLSEDEEPGKLHNFSAVINGADSHTLTCEDCGVILTESHDWSNKDGVCADCGYECQHDWSNKDSVCKDCGYECTHPTKEHVNEIPADCENANSYDLVCKDCGITMATNQSDTPAIGHSLVKVATKDATCAEDGVKKIYYECEYCHKWFSDKKAKTEITEEQKSDYIIVATGHTTEEIAAKDATCTKAGNIAHYKCSACGKLFEDEAGTTETTLDEVTIKAKGHTALKDDDGKIVYRQMNGKHYKVCSVCSTDENEVLFDGTTCTCDSYTHIGGKHTGVCNVCGLKFTQNCDLQWVAKVSATSESAGVKGHYKCTVCNCKYLDSSASMIVNDDYLKIPTEGKTLYWSGRKTAPTETDSDGNIIINTPEELAYVAYYGGSGKNYKVADGIKAFVLQPSDTTGISNLIGYNNAVDVKNYFENYYDNYYGLTQWASKNTSYIFTGTFDGNGVTVYGMYCNNSQTGLFGEVGDGTVIKNISLKSCYASGIGGLLLYRAGNAEGSKKLTVKNCEIANSCVYQIGTSAEHRYAGVVAGQVDSVDFDGLLIYNIDAYTTEELQSDSKPTQNTLGIVGFKSNDCGSTPYGSSISNSLILGIAPYGSLADKLSYALGRPETFSNVYTDMPTPAVYTNNSFSYSESQIKHIDECHPAYIMSTDTCPNLDWSKTWLFTNNGALLRSLHNFELTASEYSHYYECADCDAHTSYESHNWSKKDGVCTVCGCECGHTYTTYNYKQQLDCTHDEICDVICTVCGKTVETDKIITASSGHDIYKVDEVVATDCSHDGVREHYKCSKCEKLFEDANGTTEITDYNTLITQKAVHNVTYVAEVTPTLCTDNGVKAHYECTGCKKWFSDSDGENEITDKTDYYFIGAHSLTWVDEVSATYYSDGVKGHYVCSVCGGKFYDKNGTNPATDSDLVIARIPLTASGATGSCVWRLYGTTLVITGYGEMGDYYNYNDGYAPWGTDITEVIIEDGVTSIGNYAFYNCSSLTSITIPDSVTSVGQSTFYGCTKLTSATIPNSVTSIGSYAFTGCTSLKKVNITDLAAWCNIDFDRYDSYIFYYGARLYLNNKLVTNLVIPNGVTKINVNAFRNCDTIMKVTIPDTVSEIGECAFYSCTGLEKVILGNGLKTIGSYAFRGCVGITEIVIPEGVTSIGSAAFRYCSSLKSITIPKSATRIGYYDNSDSVSDYGAFSECWRLTKVNITDISAWCNIDFGNYTSNPLYYAHNLYLNGKLVTDLVIPDTVTEIKNVAFYGCDSLTSVTIGNSVTSIGDSAFRYCSSLKNVKISSSVTALADTAFKNCVNIETIEFPNIEIINSNAFSGLTKLKKIYLPKGISIIYSSAFSGCDAVSDIYYGGTAEEWEEVVIQHSNGNLRNATVHYNCTGLPDDTTETPAEKVFGGASLTLTNSISVNFKVKKDVIENLGWSDIYVKFSAGGNTVKVKNYTEKDGYYVFAFDNIAPDRMCDVIKATLYAKKDGETVSSETVEYSVMAYCYNMLEKYPNDTYLRTLLVDLLNFGASAQMYTGYNTSTLPTDDLTETQKSWGTQTEREYTSVKNLNYAIVNQPEATWKGGGLYFKNSVMLRFTLVDKNIDGLTVKAEFGGKTYYISSDKFVKRGDVENGYYVYVDMLGAAQMSEAVYLTVYRDETAVSNTICYSVESYVSSMADSDSTVFNDFLISMMKYGDSAKAYVQSQNN